MESIIGGFQLTWGMVGSVAVILSLVVGMAILLYHSHPPRNRRKHAKKTETPG